MDYISILGLRSDAGMHGCVTRGIFLALFAIMCVLDDIETGTGLQSGDQPSDRQYDGNQNHAVSLDGYYIKLRPTIIVTSAGLIAILVSGINDLAIEKLVAVHWISVPMSLMMLICVTHVVISCLSAFLLNVLLWNLTKPAFHSSVLATLFLFSLLPTGLVVLASLVTKAYSEFVRAIELGS